MKKILSYILISGLLAGCSEDKLEFFPNDRYTQETFWTTEQNAMAALSGCYNVLKRGGIHGGEATPLWEENASPNAWGYSNSLGFNNIASGTQTAINSSIINSRYTDCYSGIGRCNTLLVHIDEVPGINAGVKDRMKGEATFLRALYYDLLQKHYGGVPLILDEPDVTTQGNLPRNTREDVVKQVLADLDAAAAVLPLKYTGNDIGRATKGAALGLKARVLLFEASPLNNPTNNTAKWAAAAAAAKAVMDLPGTGYALFSSYRNLFLPAFENNTEVIFDIQFKWPVPDQGNSFDLINRQFNSNSPLRSIVDAYDMKDGLPPSQSPLYVASKPYENRDPRFYQTIIYPGRVFLGNVTTPTDPFKITGYSWQKYNIYDDKPATVILQNNQSETNYILLRFADILLAYAEAQNEAVGPDASVYDAVNKVRQRAGLVPYQIPSGKTQAQMRDLIRHERRIEFAGEGLYYTDIRRWKTAEIDLNATIYNSENSPLAVRSFNPARDYWWPIPQAELDLNKNLVQNPNY